MFKFNKSFLLLILLAFPFTILLQANGVRAEQDVVEDADIVEEDDVIEDDEAEVEDDEGVVEEEGVEVEEGGEEGTTEDEIEPLRAHPDVETAVLYSSGPEVDLVAGQELKAYIHFLNTATKNFIITKVEASFRYPQDFSYIIQNFTSLSLNKMIDAGKEGSFMYPMLTSEYATGRPFGLLITIDYKDTEDNLYQDAVFNQTVTVRENDAGMDAETFFMYVVLASLVGLVLFAIVQSVRSKRPKRAGKHNVPSNTPLEVGTGKSDVDYDWIPKQTLETMSKSSPRRTSPRKRTAKRSPASKEE